MRLLMSERSQVVKSLDDRWSSVVHSFARSHYNISHVYSTEINSIRRSDADTDTDT
jgi:hypothetical protein